MNTTNSLPFETEGSMGITIAGRPITLKGTLSETVRMSFKGSVQDRTAIQLGKPADAINSIATALNLGDVDTEWDSFITKTRTIPGLTTILETFLGTDIWITELAIDTGNPTTLAVAFVAEFAEPLGFNNISLDWFGLKFAYTAPKKTPAPLLALPRG